MTDAYEATCRECGVTVEKPSQSKATLWGSEHNDKHERNGEDRQAILVIPVVK